MPCYLFVHFTGEGQPDGEQIYFSVSQDGLHWQDLNHGQPVLRSPLGDLGVRDPFVVRHPQTGRFYLIATDLCIYRRRDWNDAQYRGSRALIVWESDDLTSWSEPRRMEVGVPEAGCVWAPEAIWDESRGAMMVFFASMTRLAGDEEAKQRIYAVHTRDFVTFTPAQIYAEAENHLIDTTIVHDGGWYYRFTKDETTKKILMERMRTLHDKAEAVPCATLANLPGVEGPECYPLPDGRWCLIADQFSAGKGYLPMVTDALSSGDFRILAPDEYDFGTTRKRHGGVLAIDRPLYDGLLARFA
ncbi:MAG: glycoside hydrolase family 43 protein [Aristaeellaceae bacterium]